MKTYIESMLLFIIRVLITTIVVVLSAHLIPGLYIKDLTDAIFFGLILGLLNATVRPILTILSVPVTVITLGLFTLIINAFTYWLASEISYGVHISTFWGAFWGGFAVWLTGIFTNRLIWKRNMY